MKLTSLLTTLGLSKQEAGVYMDLLEYGTQTISEIARTSKLHRPAIYRALPHLKEKGLISERRVGKLIHYAAEPPERLRNLLKPLHEDLDTMIPQLMQLRDAKTPVARRLDGIAGIHVVFEDILNTLGKGEEFYKYSSMVHTDLEKVGMPKDFEKRQDAKKLERLVISSSTYIQSRKPVLEESLRKIPEEFLPFDYDVVEIVYGNKIAFIDYSQPIATIIENAALARMQKDLFRMLYKRL